MEVATFNYTKENGWSIPQFPPLDSKNTLVLCFCAPEYYENTSPFEELKKAFPQSILAGCSTSGEIFNEHVNDASISVGVIKFNKTRVTLVTEAIHQNSNSFMVGANLAKQLNDHDLRNIFVLSDGLVVNGSELVEGLKKDLPASVIITGGLAGDGKDFKKTWVLHDTKPTTESIVAIGFYGNDLKVGYGSKGGWDVFGVERQITKSKGNVLYEIDDQPALALYKKYLGERANELPASGLLFPLAIRETLDSKHQVVRTILAVDEKEQSMTFAGDVPKGWYAQLMKADFERLITGASDASQEAAKTIASSKEHLTIAISCVGRRLILGERVEEEIESTLDPLQDKAHLIGFYSYGEISPSGLTNCDLHNQTMTLTTLSES